MNKFLKSIAPSVIATALAFTFVPSAAHADYPPSLPTTTTTVAAPPAAVITNLPVAKPVASIVAEFIKANPEAPKVSIVGDKYVVQVPKASTPSAEPLSVVIPVRYSGFMPYEVVSIGFRSNSAVTKSAALAAASTTVTATADAKGVVELEVEVPESVSGGQTLWAYGTQSKKGFQQKVYIERASTVLPATGAQGTNTSLMLVASLLLVGGAVVGVRRRVRR